MAIVTLTSNETGANSLIDINNNFADVTSSLALKANLASPTFTGSPVLPTGTTGVTQSASDNSTKVATTAYVDNAAPSLTDKVQTATISMSAADIIAMNATPKELVADPGDGFMVLLDEVAFAFTYNSVQFTGGGAVRIQYGGDTTNIMPTMNMDSAINAAANFYRQFNTKASGTSGAIPIPSASLQLTNASAAFASGNSTMKVFIKYRIITL